MEYLRFAGKRRTVPRPQFPVRSCRQQAALTATGTRILSSSAGLRSGRPVDYDFRPAGGEVSVAGKRGCTIVTTRELWRNIMHYGEFDRVPVIHWTGWTETIERWRGEGMPADVDVHAYFGTVPQWRGVGVNLSLHPPFEEVTIKESDEWRIFRQTDGVICQAWKRKSCIPHFIDFTLKTADDWPEYKKRLQPDPARIPADLDERIAKAENLQQPIIINIASMMGWTRNWMGVENMSYLMYDDRDCYAEIVDTLADLTCWGIDRVIPRMKSPPDMGFGWEDICGKTGPLVSPDIFDECVAPGYRKIRNKLESCGVTLMGIDSDGMVEPLVQHWLDSGVNVQFPIERGTWKATPEHIRRRFGKELRIVGGYDKLALEKGRAAIDKELADRIELIKQGGYVPMPDHLITPGVPLDDYKYYLDRVRELRV
jgi:uroporphyrinogen decarboxylase